MKIIVLSETWMRSYSLIAIDGSNIYIAYSAGKVAAVIYVKLCASLSQCTTKARQSELVAFKGNRSKDLHFTVTGCSQLQQKPSPLFLMCYTVLVTQLIPLGELKWDWLSSASDCIKEL